MLRRRSWNWFLVLRGRAVNLHGETLARLAASPRGMEQKTHARHLPRLAVSERWYHDIALVDPCGTIMSLQFQQGRFSPKVDVSLRVCLSCPMVFHAMTTATARAAIATTSRDCSFSSLTTFGDIANRAQKVVTHQFCSYAPCPTLCLDLLQMSNSKLFKSISMALSGNTILTKELNSLQQVRVLLHVLSLRSAPGAAHMLVTVESLACGRQEQTALTRTFPSRRTRVVWTHVSPVAPGFDAREIPSWPVYLPQLDLKRLVMGCASITMENLR